MNTFNKVLELRELGLSYSQIASKLGVYKSTVAYHVKRSKINTSIILDRRKIYVWGKISAYYNKGHTYTECKNKFGFSVATWQKAIKRGDIAPRDNTKSVEDRIQSGKRLTSNLKNSIQLNGIIGTKCSMCNQGQSWRGKHLKLQIDHIDGDSLNNDLHNIRLLCPNCHSQTDTYAGRNAKIRRVNGIGVDKDGLEPGEKMPKLIIKTYLVV